MSEAATKVLKTALSLTAIERAAIADELLSSLDRPDGRIDALWVAESDRRLARFEAGEGEAIPAEEVFAELDAE